MGVCDWITRSIHLYEYIYIYIFYLHIFISIFIFISISVYICVYIYIYIYIYIHIYLSLYVCIYLYNYVLMISYVWICWHIFHICTAGNFNIETGTRCALYPVRCGSKHEMRHLLKEHCSIPRGFLHLLICHMAKPDRLFLHVTSQKILGGLFCFTCT